MKKIKLECHGNNFKAEGIRMNCLFWLPFVAKFGAVKDFSICPMIIKKQHTSNKNYRSNIIV